MRLFIFSVMVLTSSQVMAAGGTCAGKKPFKTQISVSVELPPPLYDLKRSLSEINKKNDAADEWLVRNGMQKVWKSADMTMLGYAEGGAGMAAGFGLDAKRHDKYGVYYCLYVKHVDLSMIFRTKIVIPKNFKNGGCRFNEVHQHEYRHYEANREVVEKFTKKLEADLPFIISEMERTWPYVDGSNAMSTIEALKGSMKDAIEAYIMQGMSEELRRRNNLIDTPEEYASMGPKMQACKD